MRLGLAVAALVILTPAHAIAEVTRMHMCERAGITRVVELQSDGETGLPCRVVYKRPMEDQSATALWNAQSDFGYCTKKYDAFITKIEKKHNWSCSAESFDHNSSPTPSNLQTTAPNSLSAPTSSTDSNLPAPETPVEETKESDTIAPRVEYTATASATNSVESPSISSALPLAETRQASDTKLSMALIRQLIPSGQYVADGKTPHSGNISLCPAGGFFIWNTKQPAKPFFEMGADDSFQFDLTELTDEPLLDRSGGLLDNQCHEEIATGYCSDTIYTGAGPLPRVLSSHFGCGSNAGNTGQPRPLVLFRSSVVQSASTGNCRSPSSPHHMALASAELSEPENTSRQADGIELVILPKRSKSTEITRQDGAICRYIQG